MNTSPYRTLSVRDDYPEIAEKDIVTIPTTSYVSEFDCLCVQAGRNDCKSTSES